MNLDVPPPQIKCSQKFKFLRKEKKALFPQGKQYKEVLLEGNLVYTEKPCVWMYMCVDTHNTK